MQQQQNYETKRAIRGITIAEGIGFAILITGTILGFWSNTQTRLTVLEMQMKTSDADRARIENKIDKLATKIDILGDKIYEVKELTEGKK